MPLFVLKKCFRIYAMETISKQKDKAWRYALGMIKIGGIKPSPEFLELAEKEKKGEITTEEISRVLHRQYQIKKDAKVNKTIHTF
jgi:hypothetical protein